MKTLQVHATPLHILMLAAKDIDEVLLTDEQWKKVKRFIPKVEHPKGGRPRADDRSCFEGVLWVLKSGARWKDVPERFPSPSTCLRRLVEWDEAGVFLELWHAVI